MTTAVSARKSRKRQKGKIAKSLPSYLMMTPWLTLFVLFMLVPIAYSIFYAFTNFNMIESPTWAGLQNFQRMLDDDVFMISLKNTVIFAVVVGPIGYLMSFTYAWALNEMAPKVRSFLTVMFYSPLLALQVFFVWQYIFSNFQNGLLNSWLLRFGMIREPIAWLTDTRYDLIVCMVVAVWMTSGQSFISFIAGLQSLDRELFEAGAIDGVKNRWQELWFITLPQMKPQLLLGSVFMISAVFSIGFANAMLTGFPSTDYSTTTLILLVSDAGFTRYEMGYACAIQLILLGLMLLTWYAITKSLSRWSTD